MTDVRPGGNRRIDRVLAPAYLDQLDALPINALRARRREAEQEEVDLSYLRRLLHGRIDLVRAEQARRAGNGHDAQVVDSLAQILSESPRGTRPFDRVRHLVTEPSRADRRRRRVERLVANVDLSDVGARTDDELDRVLRTYRDEEKLVSDVRAQVQQVLDAYAAELARRYSTGAASVGDLLAPDLATRTDDDADDQNADGLASDPSDNQNADDQAGDRGGNQGADRRGERA